MSEEEVQDWAPRNFNTKSGWKGSHKKLNTNGQNKGTTNEARKEGRKWWKMIIEKEKWKYPSELGNVKAISDLSVVVVAEASMKWVKKTKQSINGEFVSVNEGDKAM